MKYDLRVGFLGYASQFRHGKNHACFVVGVHHGDQQRIGPQGSDELTEVQIAVLVDRKKSDIDPTSLKILAHFQHGWMFHRGRDDVTPIRISSDHALNRRVVALAGA